MKITIIQVGKTKQSYFQEAEQEYLKRLQPDAKIKIITLKEAQISNGAVQAARTQVKEHEAEEILKNIPLDSFVIALDERGKTVDSMQFSHFIGRKRDFEGADITFIIGGPYGLSHQVLKKANLNLSFSSFTFTHEMIRVLLLEQLYRAFAILKGKTYHY